MSALGMSCEMILNTAGGPHQLADYLPLLTYNGNLIQLGLVDTPHTLN